jgi:hypothetical protein
MTKEPAYLEALKKYSRGEITSADFFVVEREMHGDSDRAAAVVLGTFTEDALRRLIARKLRPDLNSTDRKLLFGFEGVAGTFAAKIALAYAMALIGPETRRDLDLIRLLRNDFAHSQKPIKFNVPEVAAVCAELRCPDWQGVTVALGPLDIAAVRAWIGDTNPPRDRYITACRTLSNRMLVQHFGDMISAAMDGPNPLP